MKKLLKFAIAGLLLLFLNSCSPVFWEAFSDAYAPVYYYNQPVYSYHPNHGRHREYRIMDNRSYQYGRSNRSNRSGRSDRRSNHR
jgi:hypothetical protein